MYDILFNKGPNKGAQKSVCVDNNNVIFQLINKNQEVKYKKNIAQLKMSGYEYEDETQGVTWSIVSDIKQVTEDIISALIDEIEEVSTSKLLT